MKKQSFAEKVRQVFVQSVEAGLPEMDNKALARALDLVSDQDKHPLYATLRDFLKSGEIEDIRPKVYVYKGKNSPKKDIRGAMWAVMRMRKTATRDDLQELAGASLDYANEFLRLLLKRGAIEKVGAVRNGSPVYRLVNDTGPQTPENTAKAERLRNIRAAKRAALDLIEDAGNDLISATQKLISARMAVNDLPEEATNGDE